MNTDRIKEIHQKTAFPESQSVYVALMQVWNECAQEQGAEVGKAVAEERERCKAAIAQVEAMCVSTPEYIATCYDFTGRNQAYSDGAGEALDNLADILFPEPTEKGAANG